VIPGAEYMVVYEQHGFKILRHSKDSIEATVRVGKRFKYTFLGPCTFEDKFTAKYGRQCIIVVRMDKGKFPTLEETDYEVEYPRIEILIPETIAKRMRLMKDSNKPEKRTENHYSPNAGWSYQEGERNEFGHAYGCQCSRCTVRLTK